MKATPAERPLSWPWQVGLVALMVAIPFVIGVDVFTLAFFLSYALFGAFLVARRPRNAVSWIVLAIGFSFLPTTTWTDLNWAALEAGTASNWDFFRAWLSSWAGAGTFLGYLALVTVFPTGHLPGGRWRRPASLLLGIAVADFVLLGFAVLFLTPEFEMSPDGLTSIIVANPYALVIDGGLWAGLPGAADTSMVLLLGIGIVFLLVRTRGAQGVVKLQLRWLIASIALVAFGVVFGLTMSSAFPDLGILAWLPVIVAYFAVPTAIAVAILRYRLFEIDRIISRTLGWSLVTAVIVAIFAAGLAAIQALLAGVTEGQTIAVIGSTLIAAALFQPLRQRVQSAVDRRFDRTGYDAQRVVDRFAERLRDQFDLEALRGEVATVTSETVRPTTVQVWFRPPPEPS